MKEGYYPITLVQELNRSFEGKGFLVVAFSCSNGLFFRNETSKSDVFTFDATVSSPAVSETTPGDALHTALVPRADFRVVRIDVVRNESKVGPSIINANAVDVICHLTGWRLAHNIVVHEMTFTHTILFMHSVSVAVGIKLPLECIEGVEVGFIDLSPSSA